MAQLVTSKDEIKRIRTYIEGLDEKLQGGIPEGHVVLLVGGAGTMKSSLAFSILYNEVINNKRSGLYITLEQSYESLITQMVNLDYDLDQISLIVMSDVSKINETAAAMSNAKDGSLVLADLSAIRKQVKGMNLGPSADWFNIVKNIIQKLKENANCDMFVLDSLSALAALSNFEHPRVDMFWVFEFLKEIGITSYIITETTAGKATYGIYGVEDYLADGIVFLDLAERQRKVIRELTVVKMRATKCNTDVHTLEFSEGGFRVMHGGQPPLL
ncbi:MAG: ATPase domain-containing protein [archaeon]